VGVVGVVGIGDGAATVTATLARSSSPAPSLAGAESGSWALEATTSPAVVAAPGEAARAVRVSVAVAAGAIGPVLQSPVAEL
jgi:hypothetical protein